MMYKIDKLVLITGSDIEVPGYSVKIHQPTIKEIALIGEEKFLSMLNVLAINDESILRNLLFKDPQLLQAEDLEIINNLNLLDLTLILMNSNDELKKMYLDFFNLIISNYNFEMNIEGNMLICFLNSKEDNSVILIDNELFTLLKFIIAEIFIFKKLFNVENQYEPVNEKAKEITKKLKKSKEKINAQNEDKNKNQSVFANIISILGVTGYNIHNLNNLTIYQLYNQFERYMLFRGYDESVKAALAGAKVEIVDWFKEV